MTARSIGQHLDLSTLAQAARKAADRLLWARPARELATDPSSANNPAIVTHAPLLETGVDGPLFGVPVTVKDCYATEGLRTTAGHPPLGAYVPDHDADLVKRLRAAGAVVMGKTNLAELSGDIQTDNPLFGRSNNPWNERRTAGGSSGGGAVAVALGQSRLDLASDLAGSVRLPAGFCGVAALKAGASRLPLKGHVPPLPDTPATVSPFLSAGLIARDSSDLSHAWAAISGEAMAPDCPGPPVLGWADDFGLALCPASRAGLALAKRWFAEGGCSITATALPYRLAWQAYGVLLTSESAPYVAQWQKIVLRLLAASAPKRPLRAAMLRGLAGSSFADAKAKQDRVIASVNAALDAADVLVCPLAATVAFPHAPKPRSALRVRKIRSGNVLLPYSEASIGMTCVFSLTGHPVVILPIDLVDGLPLSVQLIGGLGREDKLLAVARRLEAILAQHRAPLWQQLADICPRPE